MYVPGKLNVVADEMSRMWEGLPHKEGESIQGLYHVIFSIKEDKLNITNLERWFAEEPLFLEVVEVLQGIQQTGTVRSKQRA